MSTPDQPSQPLTRRRLRELKMTGQTPVITPEEAARAAAESEAPADALRAPAELPAAAEAVPADQGQHVGEPDTGKAFAAPERAVEYPVLAAQAQQAAHAEEIAALQHAADESTAPPADVGTRPLSRRQVREQERLRTAQMQLVLPPVEGVPTIPLQGPEDRPAAGAADAAGAERQDAAAPQVAAPDVAESGGQDTHEASLAAIETVVVGENETSVVYEVVEVPFAEERGSRIGTDAASDANDVHELVYDDETEEQDRAEDPDGGDATASNGEQAAAERKRADEEFADGAVETVFVVEDAPTDEVRIAEDAQQRARIPAFQQQLFAPKTTTPAEPESFEQILTRSADSSGSSTAGSTLILASDPSAIPLSAPITATGELIVTSSHTLPEGFGSRGHAQGTTDGKEVDVVLLDGELPQASSPTPISASDAVSTSKSPSEVIRPPAPEKTHRLTLLLGITAGVLGIALIGVVVAAFTTGVLG